MGGMKQSVETNQSALAPVAKEVSVFLKKYNEKFSQPRSELMNRTVTQLSNELIRDKMEGLEAIEESINLKLAITAIQSELLIEERTAQNNLPEGERSSKGETIISNYANKLLASMEIEAVV